jgi:predicted acetyltransferase
MESSHPQFEAVKVGIKQDNSGYILTLRIHPDDLDERIMRDFVGARYMTVMVRLNEEEKPMNREHELAKDMVRVSGMLCRDPKFWDFLHESNEIIEKSEKEAMTWLKGYLHVESRADIAKSQKAVEKMLGLKQEFGSWKTRE